MRLYTISGVPGFADVYGGGSYGDCDYNSDTTCAGTGSTGGGSTGGSLDNTGIAVGMVVGVACLLLLVVLLVRFWRRPAKLAEQPVEINGNVAGGTPAENDTTPRA